MAKLVNFRATEEEVSGLESLRTRLGLKSTTDVIRYWITHGPKLLDLHEDQNETPVQQAARWAAERKTAQRSNPPMKASSIKPLRDADGNARKIVVGYTMSGEPVYAAPRAIKSK